MVLKLFGLSFAFCEMRPAVPFSDVLLRGLQLVNGDCEHYLANEGLLCATVF